jgi:predicted TPR repeat methyltransferase
MTGEHLPTRDVAYFERLYSKNPDPWNFAGSVYERKKYAATIAMLGDQRFARGLEIGCSIGVLTKLLADCCDKLLGVDLAEQALSQAVARCAGERHVSFQRMQVPQDWPEEPFDLIVLSEILYFLNPADIARTAARSDASLAPGGVLILVNYTEKIDEPCSGEEAAEVFLRCAAASAICVDRKRGRSFRIDFLVKKK